MGRCQDRVERPEMGLAKHGWVRSAQPTEIASVLATRKFGVTCPVCKRFCFISYIEIDEAASAGELRAKLLKEGWLGEQAKCDDPKCDGQTFCAWNHAVFPR